MLAPTHAEPPAAQRSAPASYSGSARSAAGVSARPPQPGSRHPQRREVDYAAWFSHAGRPCPPLFLAPMEGLADRPFRQALAATCGGFDEACTEFIRIPGTVSTGARPSRLVRGLVVAYAADELPGTAPLAAQIMGSNPELLAEAVAQLAAERGAHRVDLNCGCPANTVTGRGAGSSLLRSPQLLHDCVAAMAAAAAPHGVTVSVKLRSGFDDTARFEENVAAAAAGGAAFVTLHPRTRKQGYSGGADWRFIARAKALLRIPVVGNGDVTSAARAESMLAATGCDGVMVGRGACTDPLIFRRIRARLRGERWEMGAAEEAAAVAAFVRDYVARLAAPLPRGHGRARDAPAADRALMGRLKQLASFMLPGSEAMAAQLPAFLARQHAADGDGARAAEALVGIVERGWGGPPREVLIDNFSGRSSSDGFAGERARVVGGGAEEAETAAPPVAQTTCC